MLVEAWRRSAPDADSSVAWSRASHTAPRGRIVVAARALSASCRFAAKWQSRVATFHVRPTSVARARWPMAQTRLTVSRPWSRTVTLRRRRPQCDGHAGLRDCVDPDRGRPGSRRETCCARQGLSAWPGMGGAAVRSGPREAFMSAHPATFSMPSRCSSPRSSSCLSPSSGHLAHALAVLPPAPDAVRDCLVLGLGCECGTSAGELIALAEDVLAGEVLAEEVLAEEVWAGQRPDGQGVPLPGRAVLLSAIATIDGRVAEPAMHATAAHFGVPLLVFGAARLECETPRLATPSEVVFRLVGCHGVAESAALAAAGPDGALVVAKRKSARATAALARIPADKSPSGFSGFVESKQVPERAFSCDDSASSCFDSGFSGICVAARPGS